MKANEIIYFAQDFILNARTAPSSSQSVTNFIFDLGGNTFYLRGQMNLSTSGINYSFTFRNGTIDATQAGSFSGNPNDTGVFTFDNVYINYTGTGQFFNTYGGILVLKNSTFYGASGYLISFDVANKYFSLQISDSTVTAKRVIRTMRINAVSELDYDEFFIKNSVINVSEYLMQVVNAQSPTQDNYINFDITGSKITAPIIMQVAANTVGIAKVRMSNTYLAKEAKIQIGTVTGEGTDAFSLDIATGERIMEISGVEGYSYLINKVPLSQGDFTANLTLYSDFTINFFANSDKIKEVQLNGNTLSGEAYGDSTKYTIPDIAPYSAANDLSFTVIIENNGITYKVPLAYSILKYANTVIAGNYTDADKQLVSAVMAYIVSAYEYTDNTAPEFSGVEYSSAEIGEAEAFSHEAISSVQLSLGSGVKVRFNLKSDYYGKLIVGDTVYEIDKDAPGTVGAVNYVTVNLRAYELYNNGIEVSDASGTSVYTLANYVEFANNYGDTKLIALIDALVDYSYYASESKNSYREEK